MQKEYRQLYESLNATQKQQLDMQAQNYDLSTIEAIHRFWDSRVFSNMQSNGLSHIAHDTIQ